MDLNASRRGSSPKLLFVAAPLVARSGVYHSSIETVDAACAQGLPWNLLLGVSALASGASRPLSDSIREVRLEPSGFAGLKTLVSTIEAEIQRLSPDILVSLTPQSDMALSRLSFPWVAYLRGHPWPKRGEAPIPKRLIWQLLERHALSRATDIWSTTSTLINDIPRIQARIVPPGIKDTVSNASPREHGVKAIWAARFDIDKDPKLFIDALSLAPEVSGSMFGSGPLEQYCRSHIPANVKVQGWVAKEKLWDGAGIYVGTSHREAFGRSAVEAAMNGIPVVLSAAFGAAQLLYKDKGLAELLVLDSRNPTHWATAISELSRNRDLYREASQHVRENAQWLTIDKSVSEISAAIRNLDISG